jgi:hypothetical protein
MAIKTTARIANTHGGRPDSEGDTGPTDVVVAVAVALTVTVAVTVAVAIAVAAPVAVARVAVVVVVVVVEVAAMKPAQSVRWAPL